MGSFSESKSLNKTHHVFSLIPKRMEVSIMSLSQKLLPLAVMEKILKAAGAERVSDKAKEEFKAVLEDIALELGAAAVKFSLHAGRKTVKAEDIKLAAKR